jgi:Spy/CpxP family protein refolding chaperone
MHPFAWWHARRSASCGENAGCGPHGGPGGGGWGGRPGWGGGGPGGGGPWGGGGGGGDDAGGGGFGVRRPLRFLAHKLELDERQVTELAVILDELKTERAQSSVDHRRTTSAFADAVAAESFDDAKAKGAADERVKSTERVQSAVAKALGRIHGLLSSEQRAKFAYLLRTGMLGI